MDVLYILYTVFFYWLAVSTPFTHDSEFLFIPLFLAWIVFSVIGLNQMWLYYEAEATHEVCVKRKTPDDKTCIQAEIDVLYYDNLNFLY